jgi:YHS domain-containing protein
MNKITTLTLGVIFLTMGFAFAQQTPSTSQTTAQPIQVGNKICPVSGGPVAGSMGDKPVQYVYKGKIYNLCCPGCLEEFKKNPEKYSKIAEDEAASKK